MPLWGEEKPMFWPFPVVANCHPSTAAASLVLCARIPSRGASASFSSIWGLKMGTSVFGILTSDDPHEKDSQGRFLNTSPLAKHQILGFRRFVSQYLVVGAEIWAQKPGSGISLWESGGCFRHLWEFCVFLVQCPKQSLDRQVASFSVLLVYLAFSRQFWLLSPFPGVFFLSGNSGHLVLGFLGF